MARSSNPQSRMRITAYLFGLIVLCLSSSCTNDDDIGELYGKWQLQSMEATRTHAKGSQLHYFTEWQYDDNKAYLNFEGKVCQMQIANDLRHELSSVWAAFSFTTDSLIMQVITADYVEGTIGLVDDNSRTMVERYFGMTFPYEDYYDDYDDEYWREYSNSLHFGYRVSADKLIITNDSTSWVFRSYGF